MRRCLEGGASRNPLLLDMYAVIEHARHGAIRGSLKRCSDSSERRGSYHQDHVELIDALTARDPPLAVAAMEAHLRRVEANLVGTGAQGSDG